MLDLNTPIEAVPFLRSHKAKLRKIGVETLGGLFYYLPRRYNDFSKIVRVIDLKLDESATIHGQIQSIKNIYTRGHIILTEAIIKDESGSIMAMWFNQPYLIKSLLAGSMVSLAGKPALGRKGLYFPNPVYESYSTNESYRTYIHTGRLVPVYPETKGISSRWLRYIIYPLLPRLSNTKDFLPLEIVRKEKLQNLPSALRQAHFPNSFEMADKARRRLSFDELFLIQLSALKQRENWNKNYAVPVAFHEKLTKKFVAGLPFKLTDAQRKAAWEVIQDTQKGKPMNRLLNGDVGSGKTVVAAIAALQACLSGYQAALMAPTEILAKQHYQTLSALFDQYDLFGIKCGLLTSSSTIQNSKLKSQNCNSKVKTKNQILKEIEDGEINFVIGTHSLIQDKVKFKNLALVVIDEQHRFGVAQRAALQNKLSVMSYKSSGDNKCVPHLLSMTATPIPRTLALTIYGDLDISILDEMPKGRQKIITQIVMPNARAIAYNFVRGEIQKGRQVFVVCPRIEEKNTDEKIYDLRFTIYESNQKNEIKSVKAEYKKLSEEIFPEFKTAMMHGRLKPEEREKILRDFKENKIQILVSTSMIEVGIDMPNASIMIIEGAERFGLAQLHQFRGRVGRGEYQSYCFIFTESEEKSESARLKALIKSQNGFELAEKDLAIRGPGNVYGVEQWGLSNLTINILADAKLLKSIRESAAWLIKTDSELNKYPLLKERLRAFGKIQHFE